MEPRIYLDADSCDSRMVAALTRLGFVPVLGTVAVAQGASDAIQLATAVAMGRVFITANTVDFVRLHSAYAERGERHFGIVTWAKNRRRSPEAVAAAIADLLEGRTRDSLRDSIHGP